jgi:hypothetical protein
LTIVFVVIVVFVALGGVILYRISGLLLGLAVFVFVMVMASAMMRRAFATVVVFIFFGFVFAHLFYILLAVKYGNN